MNVKEHANTRFTKHDHALNQSFHVSTEELTSQAIKDVSACRATLVSSAKKVLKAVVVCMKGFSVFFCIMKWALSNHDFSKNQCMPVHTINYNLLRCENRFP